MLCSAAAFARADTYIDRAALVRREGMAPVVATAPGRWFGSALTAAGDGRREAALADLAGTDPEGYARVCEAIAGYDVRDRLGAVGVPLLAVAGADDTATPPAMLAEVADGVVDGRLEILPGVGHLAPYEDPGAVAALLRTFLGAHVPA